MKRAKLFSTAVALLVLSLGLMIGCENNPVAPVNQTSSQPTLQLVDGVQPQPLTAEAIGLAKSVGLRSSSGKINERKGGWLAAPGVLLHLPPDNDWKGREKYYFEITLADNVAELGDDSDHGGGRGHKKDKKDKDSGLHFGQIKQEILFGFTITLYDHKGNQVHINLDYSAWPDLAGLNKLYKKDEKDTQDGTATLYINKFWLKYLNVDMAELANQSCFMAHLDPDKEDFDGNEISVSQDYVQWLEYDLPGFSKWAWVW